MPEPFPVAPFTPDGLLGVPLRPGAEPRRVVVIRLHAFGDAAITFPVLAALRRRLPRARLDVVTDFRQKELFRAHRDVDRVFSFDTRRGRLGKGACLLRLALALRRERLPAVLDLQRNRFSLFLGRAVRPAAWVGFDRHAPRTALTRYLDAASWLGLDIEPVFEPFAREPLLERARGLLLGAGWNGVSPLVCLNPAAGWESRQWPIGRYVELGRRLMAEGCQPLALSGSPVPARFVALKDAFGKALVDLTGATAAGEALAAISFASLAVSEDSGLMHLAWVQGVPTLALFGASRSAWSRPEGPLSGGFYSEDLACGACMQPVCARGDLLCLSRVTVDEVLARARTLISAGLSRDPRALGTQGEDLSRGTR